MFKTKRLIVLRRALFVLELRFYQVKKIHTMQYNTIPQNTLALQTNLGSDRIITLLNNTAILIYDIKIITVQPQIFELLRDRENS